MSIKSLKKALKKGTPDTFEDGTVIRWTSSRRYTYAAIKTPVGWATTAQNSNTYVPRMCNFETLLEVLGRSETSSVRVAASWADPMNGDTPQRLLKEDGLTSVELNRLAQQFFEASGFITTMTDKPQIVEGLRAVFISLGIPVPDEA